jgi:RNA polymerase sigma-70 factor (ECF subfamily)
MQVGAPSSAGATEPRPPAEALWLGFREQLRAFVARRISNRADVDDIVQWVFLRMHQRLGQIRQGDRIHAWLYSTARHAIADYYRSGSRREVAAGNAEDLEGLHPAWEVPRAEDDAARDVAACLAPLVERLGTADQEAIRLTEVQGLGMAEAAVRAGISLSGMKSRAQRARARLRKAMLDCCHVALDGRGAPLTCARREPTPGPCCPPRNEHPRESQR